MKEGRHYEFFALLKTSDIRIPRRTVVAPARWRNEQGNTMLRAEPTDASYRPGARYGNQLSLVPFGGNGTVHAGNHILADAALTSSFSDAPGPIGIPNTNTHK